MRGADTLRILVDLTRLHSSGQGGGIKPALFGLLTWCSRSSVRSLEFFYIASAEIALEIASFVRPIDRIIRPENLETGAAALLECDVVYCPFGSTDWACPGIPTVTLVVDLLHRDFPATISKAEQQYRENYFQKAVEITDVFQVISDWVGERLRVCYPAATGRYIRTYLPVHGRLNHRGDTHSHGHYFFYPANGWVHKNHETLLVAFSIYRDRTGSDAWRLVLCGDMRGQLEHLRTIADTLGISAEVDFCGFVDESTLAWYWRHASALVFPSLHEGFGIPLLEAMAHDVPIIAADSTVIPEIVGDAALLVQGRSPLELAQGLEKISTDPALRSNLVRAGRRRLEDFLPEREFSSLIESFAQVAERPSLWRRSGYHALDGLTDPVALFALPPSKSRLQLHYVTKPLGIERTVEVHCGPRKIATLKIPAYIPSEGVILLPPDARVILLKIPDASRLDFRDPRIHGILLEKFAARDEENTTDLLVTAAL